jgi:hypothetical protein
MNISTKYHEMRRFETGECVLQNQDYHETLDLPSFFAMFCMGLHWFASLVIPDENHDCSKP